MRDRILTIQAGGKKLSVGDKVSVQRGQVVVSGVITDILMPRSHESAFRLRIEAGGTEWYYASPEEAELKAQARGE